MNRHALLGLLPLVLATGCDGWGGACTASVEPSLIVFATDSLTGDTLGVGIHGTVQGAGHSDTLSPYYTDSLGNPLAFVGPYEAAGSFTITIEHADYQTWHRSGVKVSRGECHVETRTITARMSPST